MHTVWKHFARADADLFKQSFYMVSCEINRFPGIQRRRDSRHPCKEAVELFLRSNSFCRSDKLAGLQSDQAANHRLSFINEPRLVPPTSLNSLLVVFETFLMRTDHFCWVKKSDTSPEINGLVKYFSVAAAD